MALLKAQKEALGKTYVDALQKSRNVTVLSFDKIPVNEINQLRMDVADAQATLQVVKKRVFLKTLPDTFSGLTIDQSPTTMMLLYSHNETDEYAALKMIQKYVKKRDKDKKEYVLSYIGGRFENEWKQAVWVKELASLPTKEELVGKLLFLLNHPVSSFARALQAIADKKAE